MATLLILYFKNLFLKSYVIFLLVECFEWGWLWWSEQTQLDGVIMWFVLVAYRYGLKYYAGFSAYVTVCSINGMHPRPRKVLQLFRLRQINNGVFVRLNKATLNMLKIAEPYVAWGYVYESTFLLNGRWVECY